MTSPERCSGEPTYAVRVSDDGAIAVSLDPADKTELSGLVPA